LSQSLSPIVRVHYGWHWAFALSGFGLMFGVAQFFFQRRFVDHIGSAPDFQPLRWRRLWLVVAGTLAVSVLIALIIQHLSVARAIVWLSAAALLGLFLWLIAKGKPSERAGLIAMLLLTAQAIIFFICYQQMSTSLTLFAVRNVNLNFYGYQVPPEQFQVLNPFWIAVFSPILAILYTRLGKKGKDPTVGTKFAIGFVLLAAGFFLYGVSGKFAHDGHVSAWWMIWGYLFQSIGELLISGLGLSMVSRYVGPGLRGLMMGAWLLATGIAQFLGSMVANLASIPKEVTDPLKTLPIYTDLFNKLGVVAIVAAGIMIAMLPLLKKLDTGSKQIDPA
ncbi:MAG TPA: oligopeptide:H+ symporter, partial [Polyangia bacterium]